MIEFDISELIRDEIEFLLTETVFVSKGGGMREINPRKPSKAKIKSAIDHLKKERRSLPRVSPFGDPNWEMIDAQLAIPMGEKTSKDFSHDVSKEDGEGIDPIELVARTTQRFMDGIIDSLEDDKFFMMDDIKAMSDAFEERHNDDDVIHLYTN